MRKLYSSLILLALSVSLYAQPIGPVGVRKTKGTATYTVAASNSSAETRRIADYVCDGVADDVTIQAAITASGGGRIYCKAGHYTFQSSVNIADSNTILEFAPDSYITIVADGNTLNSADNGGDDVYYTIRANALSNVIIKGCKMDWDAGAGQAKFPTARNYAGIWLQNCNDSRITGCKVSNVVLNTAANNRAYGILISDGNNNTVEDSETYFCGYEGFGIRGNANNCRVINCKGNGHRVHLGQISPWAPSFYGTPMYCVFDNVTDTNVVSDEDLVIHNLLSSGGEPGAAMFGNEIRNCHVSTISIMGEQTGTKVTGNTLYRYIAVTPGNDFTIRDLLIAGNFIRHTKATGGMGIDFHAYATSGGILEKVIIANNVLERCNIRFYSNAAYTTTVFRNIDISHNTIDTNGLVIADCITFTQAGTAGWNNIKIHGNTMRCVNYNCVYAKLTGTGDINNLVIENNTGSCYCFLKLETTAGTATTTNIFVNHNTIINAVSIVIAADAYTTDIHLEGNHIITCGRIFSGASNRVYIQNNIIDAVVTAWFSTAPASVYGGYNHRFESVSTTKNALNYGTTDMVGSAADRVVTLPDGYERGEIKKFIMSNATNSMSLSVTHHLTSSPETFTFDAVTDELQLQWCAGNWVTILNSGVAAP